MLACRHPRVAHQLQASSALQLGQAAARAPRARRARVAPVTPARAARRGRAEIEGMMAIVVRGDAMSPDDVAKAFAQIEQVDAVVSTIGGTPADPNADSQARPRAGAPRSLVPASRRAHAPTATGCAASPNGARSSKCAAGHTYAARAFCGLPRPAGVRGRLGSCTRHAGASRAAAHINLRCMPVDALHLAHSRGPTPAPRRAGQHKPGRGGGAPRREALCAGHLDWHRRQPRRAASAGTPACPKAGALRADSACVLCRR